MFYKRENIEQWHHAGIIIVWDRKQILVKNGSTYVRVETCRITHVINSDQNEIVQITITEITLIMKVDQINQ